MKKFVETIPGDGRTCSWTVTHNLGTDDVIVQVYNCQTNSLMRNMPIKDVAMGKVIIKFQDAPHQGDKFKVVVIG